MQFKTAFAAGIACLFLTSLMQVTIPKAISTSIDLIAVDTMENSAALFQALLLLFGLSVGVMIVRTLSRVFFFNTSRRIEYQIKNDLFAVLTKLPKSYFEENPSGGLISYLNNNIAGIRLLFGFGSLQVLNILFNLSLTPYMMFQISPSVTLAVFIPVVAAFWFIRTVLKRLSDNMDMRQKELGSLSGFAVTMLTGINEIKSYQIYDWSMRKFGRLNSMLFRRSLKISGLRSTVTPLLNNIDNVLRFIVLVFGGFQVINGQISIGDLAALMVYAWLLAIPIGGMGWVSTVLQESLVNIRSLTTIFNQTILPDYAIPPKSQTAYEYISRNGISISGLSYRFADAEKDTLSNISFHIAPGSVVGILGAVGSGKSVLTDCINKYLAAPAGCITTGGEDIRSFSFRDWRSAVRTVTEHPFLFSADIEENICFGNCDPSTLSEEDWAGIFQRSALTEEIASFPNGRKTPVGEKGIKLSGGQKQRISLARALVKPSALLILDNVLSAVDYDTERRLIAEILKQDQFGSLLIISHRTDAMVHAQKIIVLDSGNVIEQGTHEELMQKNGGYYAKTWALQHASEQTKVGSRS